MTLPDVQRALLAVFAAREVGPKGSLEEMRAVACCLRERVRAGWHEGSWLLVMEYADEHAAHVATTAAKLNPNQRSLQRMLSDVDDIYYGQRRHALESGSDDGESLEASIAEHKLKYWCFLNRPMTPWFKANIARDMKNHPMRAQVGLMMFYE